MIESLGVPHSEVDLILVNGVSVDFAYIVRRDDRISVYPMFERFDITSLIRLRPEPLRISRFIVDSNLGKLARLLRMLGFDTLYRNDYDDAELVKVAGKERRIVLTRDRGVLKRRIVTHGYFVRATKPWRQLEEVVERLDLYRAIRPLRRCMQCNGAVEPVAKQHIAQRLQANTRRYFDRFWICGTCERIYWQGSHYQHMQRLIAELLQHRSLYCSGSCYQDTPSIHPCRLDCSIHTADGLDNSCQINNRSKTSVKA